MAEVSLFLRSAAVRSSRPRFNGLFRLALGVVHASLWSMTASANGQLDAQGPAQIAPTRVVVRGTVTDDQGKRVRQVDV